MSTIQITPTFYRKLKRALEGHDEGDTVKVDGNDFLVSYGRYLIEYIESIRPSWADKKKGGR